MEKLFTFIILLIFSIILSIQDLKKQHISNFVVFSSILIFFIFRLIFSRAQLWLYLISSAVCGVFYFFVRIITNKKLGMGDVYFGFFQGLVILPQFLWICFALEVLTAIIFNVRSFKTNKRIPFIPYMSAGLVGAFVFSVLQL